MMLKRQAAVAGMFYSDSSEELERDIRRMLSEVLNSGPAPKAIIAPHAGYIYSGSIAASAYARLTDVHDQIKRIVLLGPAHRIPFRGLAVSSANYFSTPLGDVELDRNAIDQITDLPQVHIMDEAHALEHSLEVHLPFLQVVLDDFKLIPIVVGDASAEQVDEVLEKLWGGSETLVVISSDLSHYHDYLTAKAMDASTSSAIEKLQLEMIEPEGACGRNPIKGLLLAAKKHDLKATTVDLRNSGDTAGSKDSVVGYGSYVFD